MKRTIRQPRCSTDPEPSAVDAAFALALIVLVAGCFVALWCGVTYEMIVECVRRVAYRL